MATSVYEEKEIELVDGTILKISPLKIKYMRKFMKHFMQVNNSKSDDEAIDIMVECVRIAMEQYYPEISGSPNDIEDNLDMQTIYQVLDVAGGIKISENNKEDVKEQATKGNAGNSWEDLDLLKLESELFLIGAWKNYDDLEENISMPELLETIATNRELDRMEKKFLAAIQGVDLDEETKEEDPWEEMKKRILYKGKDPSDITNLTGKRAADAGFGIGHGMDYEEV